MASDMLQKVAVDAEAEHKRIEAAMKVPNDKQAERWMELYELANNSKYFDAMIQYYLALATDVSNNNQAAMAARTKIADDAMKYLEQFDAPADDPKAGGIQPLVRLRRAKLAMAKKDFETAKKLFQTIVTGKMEDGKPIVPAPTPLEQYQARYFSAQSDVLAGHSRRRRRACRAVPHRPSDRRRRPALWNAHSGCFTQVRRQQDRSAGAVDGAGRCCGAL